VGFREHLKRLEREAKGEMISIPQRDGTVKTFPKYQLADAYLNVMARLGAGEDAPPEHPLVAAARNSSDREWQQSIYSADETWTQEHEDLSE